MTAAVPVVPSVELAEGDTGVLWAFTVQRFAPKPPYVAPADGFVPYVVGYVETARRRVEAIIDLEDVALARIGMPLERVPREGVPHYRPVLR